MAVHMCNMHTLAMAKGIITSLAARFPHLSFAMSSGG